jgi:hypothetical protein
MYYEIIEGLKMPWNSLRKDTDKIHQIKANLKAHFSIPSSNNAHRRVVLAILCLLIVVAVGTFMENSKSNKAFAFADSVTGLGVGIYWDQGCTNKALTLDWGQLAPGSNNTLTVYAKNEGNSAIYLWMTTLNWSPSAASSYMNLNWNYQGQILNTNQVIPIELTLSVSQNITGITNFSFGTTITSAS